MRIIWSYCFMTVMAVMILNPLLLLISEHLSVLTPPQRAEARGLGPPALEHQRLSRRITPGLAPEPYPPPAAEETAPESALLTDDGSDDSGNTPEAEDEEGEPIADGLLLDSSWKGPDPVVAADSSARGERGVPGLPGSLLGRDVVPRADGARSMVAWKPAAVRHAGRWWAFFTQYNPTFGEPWFLQGWINAAVSRDLDSWEMKGAILPAVSKPEWLSGRMLSASALSHGGSLYVYYSAASILEPKVERIGLAVLEGNSSTWQRLPVKAVKGSEGYERQVVPLVEPNPQWYDDAETLAGRPQHPRYRGHVQWRDPWVVGPVRGKFYMFISASCAELASPWRGCIGLAVADQPAGPWEVREPALLALLPEEDRILGALESLFYEMERPCVFEHGGQWHMLVSSPIINRNPRWKSARLVQNRGARLFHFVADQVQGPYEPFNNDIFPQVRNAARTGMYGITVVPTSTEKSGTHQSESEQNMLLAIGGYDVRKHPGGKSIRHEMHGTLEVSHRYWLDWPDHSREPVLAGRVPFGWKIDTYDMEAN